MARKAKDPKAVSTMTLEGGCLRYCSLGKAKRCRDWSHCFECWADAGEKVKDQVVEPTAQLGRVPLADFVESGVHMLADLIAKRRSMIAGRNMSPLTSASASDQDDFLGASFHMRSYKEDQSGPNFEWMSPKGEGNNIMIWWYKHGGRASYANREIKGREWTDIIVDCLKSLGSAQ